MPSGAPERALTERIKELRRRHFGPQGRAAFARRLGLALEEYTRFERGVIPPGDVLVRICEVTGEDLQWLLTGVAGRGTVVISGTRGRHQGLLARLARLLDERPECAAPIEAFVDLLVHGAAVRADAAAALAPPTSSPLIPLFEPERVPRALDGGRAGLVLPEHLPPSIETERCTFAEPAMSYTPEHLRPVDVLTVELPGGERRRFISAEGISRFFPRAFGVRLADDLMRPMFAAGDVAVVATDAPAKVGRPALCLIHEEPTVRCRIWLGTEDDAAHLGRLADGACEDVPRVSVQWSLEVLFRLTRAA